MTCFEPLGSVMVPTLPVTPVACGVAEVVVMGGQACRHWPVQALVPELALSFVK